jgi:farnesyl-diphosphate farnesyltransferase
MYLKQNASEILKQTSRTFYPSIMQLPQRIREAVMSAYLLLRAIDEIEDHPHLDKPTKIRLLSSISVEIKQQTDLVSTRFSSIFRPYRDQIPEVTSRIDEWLALSPHAVAPAIHRTTSVMAQHMAYWVNKEWRIRTKNDLDRYTFNVAGAVGILLSELWVWYDGTTSQKRDAISCGRGLFSTPEPICSAVIDTCAASHRVPFGNSVEGRRLLRMPLSRLFKEASRNSVEASF